MVKAYLNYEQSAAFGLTATPTANLQLLPGVGPHSSSSTNSDLVWCCCGSEAVLWHTQQRQRLLRLRVPAVVTPDGDVEGFRQRATVVAAAEAAAAVAVGYSDGSIRIWSVDTTAAAAAVLLQQQPEIGPPTLELQGHRGNVNALQWAASSSSVINNGGGSSSSREDLLLSGGSDGDIIVWDVESGSGRCRLRGHTQPVTALLALQPNAAAAAADAPEVGNENAPEERRSKKRKEPASGEAEGTSNSSNSSSSSSSGSLLLVSGSKDGLIKIWDVCLQLCLYTAVEAAEAAEVWAIAVNACQTRLFVGGGDYKVRVFALHLRPPAATAAAAGAAGVEAAAAQSIWAMTTYLGSVHPNRSSKKQRIRQLQFVPTGEPLSAAAATAAAAASQPVLTGGLLLCCSGGSRIIDVFRCYNAAENQQQQQKRERRLLQRLKKKQKQQEDSHDANQQQQAGVEEEQQQRLGEVLFVGSLHADASIKGFHARVASSRSHMCVRICLNLSNNSLELWKANPALLRKHSLDSEAAFERVSFISCGGHAGQMRSLSTSHDDGYILSTADEGAKIWNVARARCVKTLPCEEPQCGFVVAGNEHIVLGCRNGQLVLFDLGAAALLQRTEAHAAAINALAEHPKHTGFASASSDRTVKLFAFYLEDIDSAFSGKKKEKQQEHHEQEQQQQQVCVRCEGSFSVPDEALDVAFDPTGNLLIVALIDHTILVLHADTGRIRLSLYGHKLPVTSISVASSGALLASGSVDKSLKIWGLDFGDIRKSFRAHDEAITKVSFLPLTHYVLSVSLDGFIKQWDVDRQVLIKVFACGAAAKGGGLGGAPLLALCLSADGDYFCCCDSSRQLHLWRRTEEQVFAEEQQEKRLLQQQLLDSEGFDAAAANTAATAAATAATVVLDRPTRRTDEVLRTADKLIEALQVARDQWSQDEAYAACFQRWTETVARAAKKSGAAVAAAANPIPAPSATRPELLGRSANEHLLKCIYSIRSSEAAEVLLALPVDYALQLLQFLTEFLEKEAERRAIPSAPEGSAEIPQQLLKHAVPGPTELAVRLALHLVQLHFRLFIASEKHRALVLRLRSAVRPLLLQQRDALRFNAAAMGVLLRCMSTNSSDALQLLKQQVSVTMGPPKKKRHKAGTAISSL
ncbi:WD-40 repeat protein, putative [Eimeria necatrix]|uniref:WD-40 repeat protein, putative n=1 Tax=Eimeria necatrix TaxID=51315 RepID=U6MQZ4_9EIME|nr:WD-40 repeat protein, putative [Eimeria necatrix]CDJ64045.1 WD-40 repeat protein, putative [Eimeria necatrix]